MEFTEALTAFGGGARISPDGHLVAAVSKREPGGVSVEVYLAGNGCLQRRVAVPVPAVEPRNARAPAPPAATKWDRLELAWAPDSRRLALVNGKLARVFVWDLTLAHDLPICTVQENVLLGFDRVVWMPDSRGLLAALKHRVAIRVWRLDERAPRAAIASPKYSDRGLCFTEDGRYMAVLHRKNHQDSISVYNCRAADGEAVLSVQPPESAYLEDIAFAPIKDCKRQACPPICAWESPAYSNRLFVFSPDGQSCRVISGHEESLMMTGYERMVWSRAGWIAAAVKDHVSFVVWNAILQKMCTPFELGPAAVRPGETIVFREKIIKELQPTGTVIDRSRYESGFHLQLQRTENRRVMPNLQMEFSPDSAYIAAVSSEYPNCVWIINISELAVVAILQQATAVRSIAWHDASPVLSVVTDSPNVHIWQPTGCLCIPQPAVPDPRQLKWAKGGDTLMIVGGDSFCLAVPDWATY